MRNHARRAFVAPMCAFLSGFALTAVSGTVETVTLNGTTYECPAEDTTITALTVTTGTSGNVIRVPEGVTLTVTGYMGGGSLEKTGAGKLVICDIEPAAVITASAGEIFFAKSTGVESLASGAFMHLDASKAGSVTTVTSGSKAYVTKWHDVRDAVKDAGSAYTWMAHSGWSDAVRPRLVAEGQNGLPTIDFLAATPTWNDGAFLFAGNLQGADAEGTGAYEGPGIKGVREVFIVAKDSPGTKDGAPLYQSFLTDMDNDYRTYFLRDPAGGLWHPTDAAAGETRKGTSFVDGDWAASSAVYPDGFHVLRVRTNGSTRFKTLGFDRQKVAGGMEYGEIVVYKSLVDETLGAAISLRLKHKWLGTQKIKFLSVAPGAKVSCASGETVRIPRAEGGTLELSDKGFTLVIAGGETCVVSANAQFPRIRADGAGAVLQVGANAVVVAETCGGTGTLVKKGLGRLEITEIDSDANVQGLEGTVALVRSLGVESLASGAFMHLDASKAGSVTTDASGSYVTMWYDVRDAVKADGSTYTWMMWPSWMGDQARPHYIAGGQNGLATLDFLSASTGWNGGPYLYARNLQGTDATGSGYYNSPAVKGVREVFIVAKDRPGTKDGAPLYQSFLTDMDNNSHTYFLRAPAGGLWHPTNAEAGETRNGTSWIDGTAAAASTVYPEGFHVLRARTKGSTRFSTLGYDRDQVVAGMEYGEIIVYKSVVDDGLAAEISRRLQHKWLGTQKMGKLTAGGSGVIETVAGETVVPARAELARLDVTAGVAPGIAPRVAAFAASGTVNVRIPDGYRPRSKVPIVLLAADAFEGAENLVNWTVSCPEPYEIVLRVDGTTLYGDVRPRGFAILFR